MSRLNNFYTSYHGMVIVFFDGFTGSSSRLDIILLLHNFMYRKVSLYNYQKKIKKSFHAHFYVVTYYKSKYK